MPGPVEVLLCLFVSDRLVRFQGFMLLALVGLAIMLASCGPAASPVAPTPAPVARALDLTPATVEPDLSPSETLTLAASATPRPAPSVTPSEVPSAAPSATPSQAPSATPSATVTATPRPATPTLDAVRLALRPVADKLAQPVFVTHAGDGSGRLFVVEKPGLIRILEGGRVLATPFLDIRDRVGSSSSEQGLLGLAFAPNYAGSGHFFVNYTDLNGRYGGRALRSDG